MHLVVFLTLFLPGSIPIGQILAHFPHSIQSVWVTHVKLISEKIPNMAPAGQRYLQKKRVLPRDTMRITIRIKSPIPSGGRNNIPIPGYPGTGPPLSHPDSYPGGPYHRKDRTIPIYQTPGLPRIHHQCNRSRRFFQNFLIPIIVVGLLLHAVLIRISYEEYYM